MIKGIDPELETQTSSLLKRYCTHGSKVSSTLLYKDHILIRKQQQPHYRSMSATPCNYLHSRQGDQDTQICAEKSHSWSIFKTGIENSMPI
jgi:hypothetical protein